ncbi:MAG: hypothetical protein IPJ90_08280 [Anaerolineaceae bacterium]|nr:hypothetical protein [Anaerolineaceae bacterium]
MQPNSPQLKQLFYDSDILCPPTFGDCLPMVLSEAGAARFSRWFLPAWPPFQKLCSMKTGLLVPPNDIAALTAALQTLSQNREQRLTYGPTGPGAGAAGPRRPTNAKQLITLLKQNRRGKRELMHDVLLTVSAPFPPILKLKLPRETAVSRLHRYGQTFGADLIDYPIARQQTGWLGAH